MSSARTELRALSQLAGPATATQVGTMLMGVVDTAMLGRFSTEALAAAAIANVWTSLVLFCSNGIIMGIDPIVSQAHGAGYGERAGLALQRGIVIALLLTLPICGLFLLTESVLVAIGQEASLAAAAGRYLYVQIPSIACVLIYTAMRHYLQGRTIVRPAMWVMMAANVVNVVGNYALIYGNLGFPELGLIGAGISTNAVRILLPVALLGLIWLGGLHEGAWSGWSRAALAPRGLLRVMALGVPIWLHLLLEIGAFAGSTLIAGYLGLSALSGHSVTMNLASLSFMVPLGISIAAATRAGNLLGAGDRGAVKQSARVAFAMGGGAMTLAAVGFVVFPRTLAGLYTTDAAVIATCAVILPIAGAFQIFDGLQVVATGVLRGMGRTRPAAWANFAGYWIVGLPLGSWLAFRAGVGVAGLWYGLAVGLALVSTALVGWVLVGSVPEALADDAGPVSSGAGSGPGSRREPRPAAAGR